jgi:hypothetical protein
MANTYPHSIAINGPSMTEIACCQATMMMDNGDGTRELPERSLMRRTGSRAQLCCCSKALAANGKVMVRRHDARLGLA